MALFAMFGVKRLRTCFVFIWFGIGGNSTCSLWRLLMIAAVPSLVELRV